MPPRAVGDGATMSRRRSSKDGNTKLGPSPGRRRWRSSDGSQKPCAQPRLLSSGQGGHELHRPKASGRGASTNSPAVQPSDYDATLRAAIERVVMSRTTIEIELAEGMASDDQTRILSIPWTPPSPHRRREIIQGEGDRPSATRPMRTEARAVLTDALRDAHRWLDELTTSPHLTIESLAAREGKTERWIRRTISLFPLPRPRQSGDRRSTASRLWGQAIDGPSDGVVSPMVGVGAKGTAERRSQSEPLGGSREPKFGVADAFPRSRAKAGRPRRIDPADH